MAAPLDQNPALWLDASRGITLVDGKVSQWADQSGNGYHATQSNAAKRPTVATGVINGCSALLFDGTDDFFVTSYPGKAAGQTMFAVARTNDTTKNTRRVWGFGSTYSLFANNTQWAWYANNASGITNFGGQSANWSIIETRRVSNSSVNARVNGGTQTSFDPFDQSDGTTLNVASDLPGGLNFWPGWIAEIIGFNSALSDEDMAAVRLYLQIKYGFVRPPITKGVHRLEIGLGLGLGGSR